MKLEVFPSNKGDCLLLTSSKGVQILVDGGMKSSFKEHVAGALSKLKALDLVYVSHIDEDHISGVLQLLDDLVAWEVHDHINKTRGDTTHKAPKVPRPPPVK